MGDRNPVVSFMVGMRSALKPPECDVDVKSFEITRLPAGLSIDSRTGVISGVASAVAAEKTYIVSATNPSMRTPLDFVIRIRVIAKLQENMNNGIFLQFTKDKTAYVCPSIAEYPQEWNKFDTEFEYLTSRVNGFSDLRSGKWSPASVSNYYYTRLTTFLRVPLAGVYNFTVTGDDCLGVFIDDFTKPVQVVESSTHTVKFGMTLTPGLHQLGILHENKQGNAAIQLYWMNQALGINKETLIANEYLFIADEPIQFFTYSSNDIILRVGSSTTYFPRISGTVSKYTIKPEKLPVGLTFNTANGQLSGAPTTAMARTNFTVTAENKMGSVDYVLWITIAGIDIESMAPGVVATYLKTDTKKQCSNGQNPEEESAGYVTGFVKVSENISYPPMVGIRPGLTKDYYANYAINFKGYINVPADGTYQFYVEGYYTANWLHVGTYSVGNYQGGCNTMQRNNVNGRFQKGANYVWVMANRNDLTEKVGTNNVPSGVKLLWAGGPNNLEIQEVPSSMFYHIPTRSFFYTEATTSYTYNVEITPNKPSLYKGSLDGYSFKTNPALPSGLYLDPDTGIITGTPAVTQSLRTEYTITAKPSGRGESYTTVVSIEINTADPPTDLIYRDAQGVVVTAVEGRIGEEITALKPSITLIGEIGARYTSEPALPAGLLLNEGTGEITGMPTDTASKLEVTIFATQVGAPARYTITFTIGSCIVADSSDEGKLIEWWVYTEQAGVAAAAYVNQERVSHFPAPPAGSYRSGSQCVRTTDDVTLEVNSTSKYGPMYFIWGEGRALIAYDKLNDGGERKSITVKGGPTGAGVDFVYNNGNDVSIMANMWFRYPPLIRNFQPVARFSISPEPEGGMKFNETTGLINGLFYSKGERTYTVTAYPKTGSSSTARVRFIVDTCPSDHASFYVSIYGSINANQLYIKLRRQDDDTGKYLLDYEGLPKFKQQKWTFCEPIGTFELTTGKTAWTDASYLSVALSQGYELIYYRHSTSEYTTQTFTLNNDVSPTSEWSYSDSYNSGWNTLSYNDDSWSKAQPGTFPARPSTTRYYRIKFSTTVKLSTIAIFVSSFTYDAGIVAYVNGVQFLKRNLPGSVDTNTVATKLMAEIKGHRASGPVSLLQAENVLAIETHKAEGSSADDPFSGFLELLPASGSDGCLTRTTNKMSTAAQLLVTGVNSSPQQLTDGDPSTIYSVPLNEGEKGTWVDFLFDDDGAEYFNSYYVTSSSHDRTEDPLSWEVYGTSDGGSTWSLVHSVSNNFFSGGNSLKNFYLATSTYQNYDGYRWKILNHGAQDKTGTGTFSAADFVVRTCNTLYCPSLDDWDACPMGQTVTQSCPQFYKGERQRTCYDMNGEPQWGPDPGMGDCEQNEPSSFTLLNPHVTAYEGFAIQSYTAVCEGAGLYFEIYPASSLPSGVLFNTKTGELAGVPRGGDRDVNKTININCGNDKSDIVTTFTIMYVRPTCPAIAGYPETTQGLIAKRTCSSGAGFISRKCSDGTEPVWNPEEDHCETVTNVVKENDTAIIVVSAIALVVISVVFFTCFYLRCIKGSLNKQKHARALGGPKHHRPQTTIHDEGSAVDSSGVRVDGGNGEVKDVANDGVRV